MEMGMAMPVHEQAEEAGPPSKRVEVAKGSRRPFSDITNLRKTRNTGKGPSSKEKAKPKVVAKMRVERKAKHPTQKTRVVAVSVSHSPHGKVLNKVEQGLKEEKKLEAEGEVAPFEEVENYASLLDHVFERMLEKQSQNYVDKDYFDRQPRLNTKMRSILVDWIVDIHDCFSLDDETLYLTVNYIDRYLAVVETPRNQLQLVGMTALLIASKFEEVEPLEIADVVQASGYTYTSAQTHEMEQKMLQALQFKLTISTEGCFLGYFTKLVEVDPPTVHMATYFSQTALLHLYLCVSYPPAELAASSLYLARCVITNAAPDDDWKTHFEASTKYQLSELLPCLHDLCVMLSSSNKLMALHRKFASKGFSRVSEHSLKHLEALLPPA